MSFDVTEVFVVLRWPADAGLPRYSFATLPHANEIQAAVERVQTCATLEAAAATAARLNDQDTEQVAWPGARGLSVAGA